MTRILLAIRNNKLAQACGAMCREVWRDPEITRATNLSQLTSGLKRHSWNLVVLCDDLAATAKLLPVVGQMAGAKGGSGVGQLICGVGGPINWTRFAGAGGGHVCLRHNLTKRIQHI